MPKIPSDTLPKVTVKKSSIHGKGLFANEKIKAGQLIGWIKTKKARNVEGPYTLWVADNKPVEVTCLFKYINHSAKPNVVYYDDGSVVALRHIKRGKELTHDYGE